MSLLAQIAAVLDNAGIRHAVIGASAMTLHGVNRATVDVDLFTVDLACFKESLWAELKQGSVVVEVRKGDFSDPLAGVVRFAASIQRPVDLVVGKFTWQKEVIERAVSSRFAGLEIPVARAADLILLKLYAGGPQDAWDIHELLAGPSREELIREVELRLGALPESVSTFWAKIIHEQPR